MKQPTTVAIAVDGPFPHALRCRSCAFFCKNEKSIANANIFYLRATLALAYIFQYILAHPINI